MSAALLLTLVRHAKSSWRFSDVDDFHRPLNKRGLRDAIRMPRVVAARVPAPDRVLCSDAVRAVQTCQALADGFELPPESVVLDHDLYLAEPGEMAAVLARHGKGASHLMLVAHNPGLTDLYNRLVDTPVDNLPTFAVAHLALDARDWAAIARSRAREAKLLLPKELLRND
jgi:phosphohistidine phosphatase